MNAEQPNFIIRPFQDQDWPGVWRILEPVFRAGETYPAPPDITEADARIYWIDTPTATYVAVDNNGTILGTFYIRPNQPGLGAHVCNCGYIVAQEAQGKGVASAMCRHSQTEALRLGFTAMQFNLVVATNTRAVRLWQHMGFTVVGTLPGAFNHKRLGFVDAYVLFKTLKG